MASLSCLSFSLEGATEGPASAGFRVLATNCSARPVGFLGFRNRRDGFTRIGDDKRNWVLVSQRFGRSYTTRRSFCFSSADKDSVEAGLEHDKVSEYAMKTTIEKSKKVLAMQRELLQQIVDRRKLVASIKNILSNPVDGDTSPESILISNLDLGSSSDNSFKEEGDRASLSGGSVELHGNKIVEKSTQLFKASSGLTSSDMKALDKKYNSGLIYSGNSDSAPKVPESPKSAQSSTSGERGRKPAKSSVPEAFSEKIEHIAKASRRLSSDFNEKAAYSEPDLAKSSSYGYTASDVSSEVKAEEMSTSVEAFASMTSAISSTQMTSNEPLTRERDDGMSSPSQEHVKSPPLAGENVMNVVMVAAECAPWKKTGGLGDVAGALPKALARRGHRVMVVVPRYGDYTEPQDIGVRKRYKVAGQDMEVNYFHSYIDGVDFVFIDSPMLRHIEKDIYGGNRMDILKRMALFCKVAVEVPWHVPCGGSCYGDGNLVFIANDWHTALLPVYLKAYYRDNGLMKYTRSVLVIHNIAHQGRGPLDDFSVLDLPEHYLDYFRLYDPVGGEHSNTFAAGIKAADRIVAVSHGYAWEVKTQEGGWGLHNIISENGWKLRGIVNGIDDKEWSPQLDEHLNSDGYTNYSLDTLQSGKAQCKASLQKELGLPVRPDVPLIGFIGRLDGQKGVDIIGEAVPWMMSQDVQLVMLGTGRRDLEEMLKKFEEQYKGSVRAWVGFSVKTAHRITAGVDVLLMPSRFEPCGLNQLYAMRYGTIPVVHAVGGLRDTVHPFDPFNETGYGWTFDRAESGKLIEALGHCLLTFRDYKVSWEGLQRRGMMQDMSWDHAAEIYEEVLVAAKYQW